MTMRPKHRRDAAVDEMTECHLFARCLGVKIDDDRGHILAEPMLGENIVEPGEWIVERVHEEAAHQIDDQHAALAYSVDPPAGAGCRFGKVSGPQQTRVAIDIG